MGEFSIGQAVTRLEDPRLLRGQGRFLDDMVFGRQVHAAIVRSPHAHAEIRAIDRAAALAAPGVLAVLTGDDYRADGNLTNRCGYFCFCPRRPHELLVQFGPVTHSHSIVAGGLPEMS